ncbi:uncharacterized protein LOC110243721 [Exaiptasia diaphana]|uniref:Chitin-binding type-4 domain-containing protein n=1 Tax=Exaiptasia diaphana TaxID=2652724 RepID=A0A913YNZ9_EXADI|nr:uncharacterized protein LOC110243721 [Exaiptasia diaphana]
MAMKALCVAFFRGGVINSAFGHGYIKNPAARNACWQHGFRDSCGEEWTMDEKNCGGFAAQWRKNGGKCGGGGDPYHDKIQKYVYPGSHAFGTITQTYLEGQEIELEFRVGDIGGGAITQDKLRYLLRLSDTGGGGWSHNIHVNGKKGLYKIKLHLPSGLTCKHCVLQWWWKTGNSWGCEMVNGKKKCGMGYGAQETFVNCADIQINRRG